jgi:hypothetical protein
MLLKNIQDQCIINALMNPSLSFTPFPFLTYPASRLRPLPSNPIFDCEIECFSRAHISDAGPGTSMRGSSALG